jgi:hypothetical protein
LYIGLNIPEGADITAVDVILTNRKVHDNLSDLVRGKSGENWTGTATFAYNDPTGDGVDRQDYETGGAVTGGTGTKYILIAQTAYNGFATGVTFVRLYGTGVEPTWS